MPCAVILTALPVEYASVRTHLSNLEDVRHDVGTAYEQGEFLTEGGQVWKVGIAEMGAGNVNAGVETGRAIDHFRPDIILLVGIAGGIKDVRIGDVVAATKVYSYETGKVEETFLTRPTAGRSSYAISESVKPVSRNEAWLQRLGDLSISKPKVWRAPIAAGEKVIASRKSEIFQLLRQRFNDAIAVEMEGHGFLEAAFAYPQIQTIVIRGISDLIEGKNDDLVEAESSRQQRAAEHASAFAFELLSTMPLGSLATARVENELVLEDELVDRYLHLLIEQNLELELPGLPGGGHHPVELENVYVALRGDRSNAYERLQGQAIMEDRAQQIEQLLAETSLSPADARLLRHQLNSNARVNFPVPTSIEERDRPHLFHRQNEEIITLGEAFQQERRLIILGDPGSGKTTLCRWLVLQLVKAYQNNESNVIVPLHHVDPNVGETTKTFDLGETRLPIFLRVAAFASKIEQDPDLRLAQYLGFHLNLNADDSSGKGTLADSGAREIDSNRLNELFLRRLRSGSAIVLLDGLDEIGDATTRKTVVREIDKFIQEFVPEDRDPQLYGSGGNKIVITSRIVGYQAAPLSNQSTHLTIEPMGERAVNRFCDVWMEAAHKVSLSSKQWNDDAKEKAKQEAKLLKEAIAELKKKETGELASNPLLITILALVFKNGKGERGKVSFPQQRVKLYELAVDILLQKWIDRENRTKDSNLRKQEMLKVLVPLAEHIHENSNVGAIKDEALGVFLSQYLSPSEAEKFKQIIQEDVGLLAARGSDVYGFLHLTFQEYLAGQALIADPERISDRLLEKLSSSRWREPILMALGHLSSLKNKEPLKSKSKASVEGGTLTQKTLERLLLDMLNQADALSYLLPRTVLLLVAALPEMVTVPPAVVKTLATRLLDVYTQPSLHQRFPALKQHIEQAFKLLAGKRYERQTQQVLHDAIASFKSNTNEDNAQDRAFAAAALVQISHCYNRSIATALLNLWATDSEAWGWPVDNALRDIIANQPALLRFRPQSLRRSLQRDAKLASLFVSSPKWIRFGIALYGGLDTSLNQQIADLKEKIASITYEISVSQATQPQSETDKLTQQQSAWKDALKELSKKGHHFSVDRIYRDSSLTPLVLECLQAGQPPESLIPQLQQMQAERQGFAKQVDICLALIALGEPSSLVVQANTPLSQQAISHASKLIQLLTSAVRSASVEMIALLKKTPRKPSSEHWIDLMKATLSIRRAFDLEPANVAELAPVADTENKPIVLAETLHSHFSGASEDAVYNVAVVLDTFGKEMSDPPMKLAQTLANAYNSINSRWTSPDNFGWVVNRTQSRANRPVDILGAAMDALVEIPNTFDFVRDWCLVQLTPLLREYDFLTEAAIVALDNASDQLDTHRETVEAISALQVNLRDLVSKTNPHEQLQRAVRDIKDPYLKFRGYFQLMRYFPHVRSLLELTEFELSRLSRLVVAAGDRGVANLLDAEDLEFRKQFIKRLQASQQSLPVGAHEAALKITDPQQQAWAFEQLVKVSHPSDRRQWLQQAFDAARQIEDSENKSRTLLRLARYSSVSESLGVFVESLEQTTHISNERNKTETLILLKEELNRYPQAIAQFEAVVSTLSDWNRNQVLGLYSFLFQQYEALSDAPEETTTALVLGAILTDFKQQYSLPISLEGLWTALLYSQKQEACKALCQQAKHSPLTLTQEAIAILDVLIRAGEMAIVNQLLPIVQNPDINSIHTLREWLEILTPKMNRYVHLLMAEAGSFSVVTVETLTDLLTDSDDFARHRAALALHGSKNGLTRFLLTASLGLDTLLAFAQSKLKLGQSSPLSIIFTWTFERIFHNDAQVIASLIALVDEGGDQAESAKAALKSIHYLNYSARQAFLTGLKEGSVETQLALLHSLCTLLHLNRISDEMWQDAFSIVQQIERKTLSAYEFVLEGPLKIAIAADAVQASKVHGDEVHSNRASSLEEQAAQAEDRFLEQKQTLLECLESESEARVLLAEAGAISFAGAKFIERVELGAAYIEERPYLFPILITWLEQRLQNKQRENPIDRFLTDDLLNVVAACAERLPNTFYTSVTDIAEFQLSLLESVEEHQSYPGRQSALVLLSYLHIASEDTILALRTALKDCIEVQHTAIETIDRYRQLDDNNLLPALFEDVLDESPTVGYSTAMLLSSIAQNIYLAPQLREDIIEALMVAIDDGRSRRSVYLFEKKELSYNDYVYAIAYKGQLDEILYDIVSQLSGMKDLSVR